MAAGDLAAKRYARAIFDLGVESNANLDEWSRAVDTMAQFMSDPEVRRVLENSRVAQDAKLHLIEAALSDLPQLPLNLARLLVRKSRTALAMQLSAEFQALVAVREGIEHVRATTAVTLNEQERQDLVQRLEAQTGKKVLLETDVNPSMVGGLVVQIGDRLIDASTRAHLAALRENLVGAL